MRAAARNCLGIALLGTALAGAVSCRAEPAPGTGSTPATKSAPATGTASKPASGIRVLDAKAKLPAGLALKGELRDAVRFQDAEGEQLLAVSLFRKGTPGEDLVTEVHAQQWGLQGGAWAKAWKLWDLSSNPLETVEYASGQYKLADADQDGRADVLIWYSKVGDGMDPDTLKLMLYAKGKKHAIRGLIPKVAEDLGRYEKNPDPSLAGAPAALRDLLAKEWEALVKPDLEALRKEAGAQ